MTGIECQLNGGGDGGDAAADRTDSHLLLTNAYMAILFFNLLISTLKNKRKRDMSFLSAAGAAANVDAAVIARALESSRWHALVFRTRLRGVQRSRAKANISGHPIGTALPRSVNGAGGFESSLGAKHSMKEFQMGKASSVGKIYGETYLQTRVAILKLSGLSEQALDDAAEELQCDAECFPKEYSGSEFGDYFLGGLNARLRKSPAPWSVNKDSSLYGLTLPQYWLAWANNENNFALKLFDGKLKIDGGTRNDGLDFGVSCAIAAHKAIAHAKALMADGEKLAA